MAVASRLLLLFVVGMGVVGNIAAVVDHAVDGNVRGGGKHVAVEFVVVGNHLARLVASRVVRTVADIDWIVVAGIAGIAGAVVADGAVG